MSIMANTPPFNSLQFTCNNQSIHVKIAGPLDAPVMLMLHGFPEYWAAWAKVGEHFVDTYRVVLPDQRGFNVSSKPQDQDAYATKHLVADVLALIDKLSPDRPVIVCGHDWGASVAYAMAMRHPDRISHLIIANGVHPMCFQKALYAGGDQTAASQYMNVLRAQGSEENLSADNFEKLLGMLQTFSSAPWMSDEIAGQYRRVWCDKDPYGKKISGQKTLSAMLNWYRSSPMIVPPLDQPAKDFPITDAMAKKFHISMPHLLLWGLDDTALLKESRADLAKFCADLTVQEKENASHWILHEHPDWVAHQMAIFLR